MKPAEGKLPLGVEFAGAVHRDYALRPQLVEDNVEIYEDPKHGPRAEKNSSFAAVCLFARRLVRLGDIPKESITPDLVMKMTSLDMAELQAADKRCLSRPEPEGGQS